MKYNSSHSKSFMNALSQVCIVRKCLLEPERWTRYAYQYYENLYLWMKDLELHPEKLLMI